MKDLVSSFWIKFKGILFLLLGLYAGGLILVELPSLKIATLLALCIWCFCRFYYFAFYVIEKYVDSQFRFSGLWDFFLYLIKRKS